MTAFVHWRDLLFAGPDALDRLQRAGVVLELPGERLPCFPFATGGCDA